MRKPIWSITAVAAAALLGGAATVAPAQTLQQRVDALEKKVDENQKNIAGKLGIDIHGLIAGDYLYNFNSPDSGQNQFRVFDLDANSFSLNQANVEFVRQKEDESVGFVLNLDFGKTAEAVGGVTNWGSASESSNSIELREAYVTYKVPFGGIKLKAGKFVTLLGYEVIKNYDNLNPNISNSFLFGYAIPFTHTGLLANFPIGDMVSIDAGVVNGWDAVSDNNDGKTFLGGIGVTPPGPVSMYISGTYGPEEPNNGHSKRGVVTGVFTIKATDMLTFVAEGDYGNESDLVGPTGMDSADWYGTAAYALIKINDQLSVNLRGEVFDDPDGVRTAFQETGFGPGVTAWEFTPTVAYQITDGLLWRAEYRHDEADKRFFMKDNHFVRGQDTIATELVYAF